MVARIFAGVVRDGEPVAAADDKKKFGTKKTIWAKFST